MLAIKDLNNITRPKNKFLPYKPGYPCTYDVCYDDVMMMQCMMQYMMMYMYVALIRSRGFKLWFEYDQAPK